MKTNLYTKIYNKGKFQELYDFVKHKLLKVDIMLTPPARKETLFKSVGLYCHLNKIGDTKDSNLEGITLNFDRKGLLRKRTEFSVDFKGRKIFVAKSCIDLPWYLDVTILDYCYEKGYKYKLM